MREWSVGQLRALSDFFNMVAVAWFTGGVITPFFARVLPAERWVFLMIGFVCAYICLNISLSFAEEVT